MASHWAKWEARIVVPTGGWTDAGNFHISESAGGGNQDLTIPAGNYWWNTGDGGGNSFIAELKSALETASANALTYTVSIDDSEGGTGAAQITVSSGTTTITWGSGDGATVQALLGNSNATETVNQVGFDYDAAVEALWLTECPYNAEYAPVNTAGGGNTIAQVATSLAPDGTFSQFVGSTHVRNRIWFEAVPKTRAFAAGGAALTNDTLEEFWDHAVYGSKVWAANPGYQLRFYPDTTSPASVAYNIVNATNGVPATKVDENYDQWWRVEFEVAQ